MKNYIIISFQARSKSVPRLIFFVDNLIMVLASAGHCSDSYIH